MYSYPVINQYQNGNLITKDNYNNPFLLTLQLFTYRIGQAQTYKGAKVTSTNTDGLFTVLDADINNKILEQESADIHVEIEPEPTYLISKDTNNRLEMDDKTGKIVNESGGTLGCRKGPNPAKALAHPAILDWALAEYLVTACVKPVAQDGTKRGLFDIFHKQTGLNILEAAKTAFSPVDYLTMFQHIVSSSAGSVRYIFGLRDNDPTPVIMQHYNRMFFVKDAGPDTVHLWAAFAKKLTPATKKKRIKNNEPMQQHDPLAVEVLGLNGVKLNDIPNDKEAVITRVTNVDSKRNVLILNRNLHTMTDSEINAIIDRLDYDAYIKLLAHIYMGSWKNAVPGEKPVKLEDDDEENTDEN